MNCNEVHMYNYNLPMFAYVSKYGCSVCLTGYRTRMSIAPMYNSKTIRHFLILFFCNIYMILGFRFQPKVLGWITSSHFHQKKANKLSKFKNLSNFIDYFRIISSVDSKSKFKFRICLTSSGRNRKQSISVVEG